jgi:plasmid stabilization system protein ParE
LRGAHFKVFLTPEARHDIAEAAAWYREQSVRAAEEFLVTVDAALARIEAQPTAQGVVDIDTGARRALLRKFPHRVLHTTPHQIRCAEAPRLLGALAARRWLATSKPGRARRVVRHVGIEPTSQAWEARVLPMN